MKKSLYLLGGICLITLSVCSFTSAYNQEQIDAYNWAYQYGITTQPTIQSANLDGNLTRQAFAKMIVNYLENVILVNGTPSNMCTFSDENNFTDGLVSYAKKTCGYNVMGLDGLKFNPTGSVDRAQLGTVISIMLWGGEYNSSGKGYYIYHLNALKKNGIMNNIDNPNAIAKRGDVLIMLKRLYEKFGFGIYLNGYIIPAYDGKHVEYYDNGQIYWVGNYKNNQLDGEYIQYYENGQIRQIINYDNGEYDGKYVLYYENGHVYGKGSYKNNKLDGEMVSYYENGQIKEKSMYKDGKLDGEVIEYHENGQIRFKGIFKNGELDGETIRYYENGQIEEKTTYKYGELNGEAIGYFEDGHLMVKGNYKNGELDGEVIIYYEAGQVGFKGKFKNGKLDGEAIQYYENASIRSLYEFGDGVLYNSYFSEDGALLGTGMEVYLEELDIDGEYKTKIDGLKIRYYNNGQDAEVLNYSNGFLDGKQTWYYENGQISSECDYENGIREVGACLMYDQNGNSVKDITILYPIWDENINSIYVIAITDLANHEAMIYLDGEIKDTVKVDSEGFIYWESDYEKFNVENLKEGSYDLRIEIVDESGNLLGKSEEIEFNYKKSELDGNFGYVNYNFADSAEILLNSKMIVGEPTDISITMIKNGSKMNDYEGTIYFTIEEENGDILKPNEYTLPNGSIYTFLATDLGTKGFQKGLEIKKEGTFYIQVEDLNDPDERALGRQMVTVVKK